MITGIYRILGCGDLIQVPSQKQDGGFITKKFIRLQEFGGSITNDSPERQSNAIVATMIGKLATTELFANDIVAVSLRFSIREYQGNWYQDITVSAIHRLTNSSDSF